MTIISNVNNCKAKGSKTEGKTQTRTTGMTR